MLFFQGSAGHEVVVYGGPTARKLRRLDALEENYRYDAYHEVVRVFRFSRTSIELPATLVLVLLWSCGSCDCGSCDLLSFVFTAQVCSPSLTSRA